MVRAAFTVKPGLRAAYACTTALGLYNVYLNGQKVSTDEMTPGWTSYNRRLLYQTYEVTAILHPGLNMAGAMLGAGWYKGCDGPDPLPQQLWRYHRLCHAVDPCVCRWHP